MLIDWFTVAAQVVNFLILVLLLKRFLYKPVLKAMEERKKRIASELEEAKKMKQDAEQMKDAYHRKIQELDQNRQHMLDQVSAEVSQEKERLLDEVHEETEEMRGRLVRSVRDEQQALHLRIREKARHEAFSLAKKVLSDLASEELESHVLNEFLEHLKDASNRQLMQQALASSNDHTIIVRSAFQLDPEQQSQVKKSLSKALGHIRGEIGFEINPELICGIEIQLNHYKLDWHFSGYLSALEYPQEPGDY